MYNGKPVIGLSCSYEKDENEHRIFLNHSYLDAIRHFGGIPVVLPSEGNDDELEYLASQCDGILFTGGMDIEPALYGEEKWNDTVSTTPDRDRSESLIFRLAEERDLPILGICRGCQLINVALGGTLVVLADEISPAFWKDFRRAVKTEFPEALIVGEVWHHAPDFLQGDEWDSVMNYPLKEAILRYLLGKDAREFSAVTRTLYAHYPKFVSESLMNLLGTHDTARILTRLGKYNPHIKDRKWQAAQSLNKEEYEYRLNEEKRLISLMDKHGIKGTFNSHGNPHYGTSWF